jgi:hypothetical protein
MEMGLADSNSELNMLLSGHHQLGVGNPIGIGDRATDRAADEIEIQT